MNHALLGMTVLSSPLSCVLNGIMDIELNVSDPPPLVGTEENEGSFKTIKSLHMWVKNNDPIGYRAWKVSRKPPAFVTKNWRGSLEHGFVLAVYFAKNSKSYGYEKAGTPTQTRASWDTSWVPYTDSKGCPIVSKNLCWKSIALRGTAWTLCAAIIGRVVTIRRFCYTQIHLCLSSSPPRKDTVT